MVAGGGGNSRMVREKDMEQGRVLMETDTLGNTVLIRNTGMEYTDGQVEEYITESGKRIREMVKDIRGGQMAMNIGDSGKIACNREKESNKRMEYFTKTHMMKIIALAGVKYSEIL
jgi:hypothetical protein